MTCKEKEEKASDQHVSTPNNNKKRSSKNTKPQNNYKEENNSKGSVFKSIDGPCPELGLLYQDYDLDTVIYNHIEGTKYTICKQVEGYVDDDEDFVYEDAPQQTKRNIDMDVRSKSLMKRITLFLVHLSIVGDIKYQIQ